MNENKCFRCGGTGTNVYTATRERGEWSHSLYSDCINHLRARAEEAEAENDELYDRIRQLEAHLSGDIQAITDDGQQHRIERGKWRPVPPQE